MTSRGERARPIGATQAPDLGLDQLASAELDGLDARFELEDLLVCSATLGGSDAGAGRFRGVHLQDLDLCEARLRAVELVDVIAERIDAANGDWGGAQLRRVRFSGARLTGVSFVEARIADVSFEGCGLDYANFRHSAIEHASFVDCALTGADFQGARIAATRFSNCQLADADFSKDELSLVDLRGSQLALAGSVLGLRGAIVDQLQLMELARPLAQQLGISVEDI